MISFSISSVYGPCDNASALVSGRRS